MKEEELAFEKMLIDCPTMKLVLTGLSEHNLFLVKSAFGMGYVIGKRDMAQQISIELKGATS